MSSVRPFGPVYSLTMLLRACAVSMHELLPALNVITLSLPSSTHSTVPVLKGHAARSLFKPSTILSHPGPPKKCDEYLVMHFSFASYGVVV